MNQLVELIAPRSWWDAVWKGGIFVVLVNLLNIFVAVGVRHGPVPLAPEIIITSMVSIPFILLCMGLLYVQRELQQKLTLLATTDMLTGLPNRRAFLARATEATEGGQSGALLLLDADHFKLINDTWGHSVGDVCLAAIAERLRRTLRPSDIVGRVGGEEFSVFLPGSTVAEAREIGERLCQSIAVEAEGAGRDLRVTLSIGATFGTSRTPLDRLMAQADHALYRAKAEGRARMVISTDGFDPVPDPAAHLLPEAFGRVKGAQT